MSADEPAEVVCGTDGCDVSFGSAPNGLEPEGQRSPCPECGKTGRLIRQRLESQATLRDSVSYGGFPAGKTSKSSRFAWGFTGWDWSVRLKRMVRKDSHFDRRGNRRYEHVEDPQTGDVLHHQDHPLTDHKGYGSDKFNRDDDQPKDSGQAED